MVAVDWQRKLIGLPDSKTNELRTIHLSEVALEVLVGLPQVGPYIIADAIDAVARPARAVIGWGLRTR